MWNANTQVAILEVARGGMLRRGLGVDRADAAAVLNVSEDHLGEFGVDDVETLIATKFLVQRALGDRGRLILNADDKGVQARGQQTNNPITWFGRALGPTACVEEDGFLTRVQDGQRDALVPVADVPLTLGGAARFNVSNALAAIGLATAINLPREAIVHALLTFESTPELNPGRMNTFRFGGITALVDFAHNPGGVHAILEVAAALPAQRRLVTLGQAGDRSDSAIQELARIVAAHSPERIILKEMATILRGRAAGEVVQLMDGTLIEGGTPADRIGHATSEIDAVEQALEWAREGDLLVFLIHVDRNAVIERLTALQDAS